MHKLVPIPFALAALFCAAAFVHAQQVLPPGQIDTSGNLQLGPVTLGKRQGTTFTFTPDRLQIKGPGSTGPIDGMTVGGTAISAILGSKAPLASPTFSGTVAAPAYTGDGSVLTVRDPVGGAALPLRELYSGTVYAALYGVVCDYNFATKTGTDNTVALSRAIAAAQSGSPHGLGKRLLVQSGACLTDPQVLSGQIALDGQSSWATALVLKSASNAPLITIQPGTSYDFPADGYPNGGITLSRLRLTSVDQKAGAAASPNAHGIKWINGTWRVQIRLSDVTIYGMPGDGVNASSAFGDLHAERTYFVNNGGRGVNSNSNNDWEFLNCQWSTNEMENILSSGDTGFFFLNPNIYSSKTIGLNAYNSDIKIFGGSIDRNGMHGMVASGVALNGSPGRITTVGTAFTLNGASKPNVYADIIVPNGSAGEVFLSQARFGKTYPATNYPAQNNVQFGPGATTRVTCRDCVYGNGSATSAGVTNVQAQFITQ